jgi:ribosomal 30S subunit maturation factor RimM
LEGFDSEEGVKAQRGQGVFIDRGCLPPPEEGEYYLEDLQGSEVRDADTQQSLGVLVGVESVGGGCPDRWWINQDGHSFAVPARAEFIATVDASKRLIWVRNGKQFQ